MKISLKYELWMLWNIESIPGFELTARHSTIIVIGVRIGVIPFYEIQHNADYELKWIFLPN
jgi:hypothetical protein